MAIVNFEQQFPNNPDISSEIDRGIIEQTTPAGFQEDPSLTPDPNSQQSIDAFNAQFTPAAIGPQGSALYPGAGHNINVGSYSGSVIGANPIFVPGGNILAVDPLLARQKAIDDAAKKRAAALKPFDYGAPSKLKDARFQQKFNDTYYNRANQLVDQAKEKYGKDFSIVLQDRSTKEGREFVQEMANFETLGREFDQIVDLMAEMDEGLQTKKTEYGEETLKLKDEFENLVGNFDKGDIFKTKDLSSMYDKLKGYRSFEDYIQTGNFFDDITGEKTGYDWDREKQAFFKHGTTTKVSFDEAIDEVVNSLASSTFRPEVKNGVYDKDFMKNAIGARLKAQKTVTGGLTQKSAATRGEEVEIIVPTLESSNFYSKDQPGAGALFSYDKEGNRTGTYNVKPLMDFQMTLTGKKKQIHERTPDGKIQKRDFRGQKYDNVQLVTESGTETIPGSVFAEVGEMTKLADGRIVQKVKVAVPTKQKVKVKSTDPLALPGQKDEEEFDSFTVQDRMMVIYDGKQGTGTMTEILSKMTDKTARENYKKAVEKGKSWQGVFEKEGQSEAESFGL